MESEKRQDATDKDIWGWIVCFGTIITFIAGIGHVNSFGVIYRDFINETKSTAKSLTTSHGTFAVMLAVGGIILNVITKKFSLRTGGFIGAAIMIFGCFCTIFISNTTQLPLTFGVLQGVGFGIMVPVCYSTINHYFLKKRTTVMSICKAVQGLILMWYPYLLKKILSIYGFRGTLLILAGISLHTLPGMATMTIQNNIQKRTELMRTANEAENGMKIESKDLINKNINEEENTLSTFEDKNDNKKSRCQLLEILNINILKDAVYCNICVGQSFVNFSDLTFFIFQPMLLFQYGYDTTQVTACISTCAGADVAGRAALACVSSFFQINTRILFYVSTLFTLLFRIVILQVRNYTGVLVLTAILGILRALLHISSPLVISNYIPHKDFPGAYALFLLITGIVNVTFSPVIGYLKDYYQDYIPAFYALALCCVPCLVCWPIEYALRKK